MTTTFADYAAAAEERKDTELAVMRYTLQLCEALRQDYIQHSLQTHQNALQRKGVDENHIRYHQQEINKLKQGNCDYEFYSETGRKYHKIIMNARGARSVHAFVDKKTGGLFKSASWKAPAKGQRFNLTSNEDREWLLKNADWASSYLYRR